VVQGRSRMDVPAPALGFSSRLPATTTSLCAASSSSPCATACR
jgi:hypothetical protein